MKKIICLWSCPRNISTALMYSFRSREDTKVFDEPLYAHYLVKSGLQHPGRNETLRTMENIGEEVIKNIILNPSAEINFHKLMTNSLIDLDKSFLLKVVNILFIRNPIEIINSYHKVIPFPTIEDIGIKMQYDLYHELEKKQQNVILLDAKELLINPEKILKKLCSNINISYDKEMLKWEKGPKNEDGSWSKYWYKNTHNSTGFNKYIKKKILLKGSNIDLAKRCENYYNFLYSKSIRIN
jgi:hypothetical protein|tara:strand:+ start:4321 stop:5040 length:720 start_codon:yes stop_codon:yes gene_type:complete